MQKIGFRGALLFLPASQKQSSRTIVQDSNADRLPKMLKDGQNHRSTSFRASLFGKTKAVFARNWLG
jgi:hypothetical protein